MSIFLNPNFDASGSFVKWAKLFGPVKTITKIQHFGPAYFKSVYFFKTNGFGFTG